MVLTFEWFSVSSLVRLACPGALYSCRMHVILSATRFVFNWDQIVRYSGALCSGRAHACDVSYSFAVSKRLWHISLLCVQWKTPDDGQRNSPKHV